MSETYVNMGCHKCNNQFGNFIWNNECWCPSCLIAEYAALEAQLAIEKLENQTLWALLELPRSSMSDEDMIHWYSCVQKIIAARGKGIRGVDMTKNWDQSPEGYEGPCLCELCQSYGD